MAVTYLQRWILIQPLWGVLVWLGLTSSSMAEVEKWQRMVLSFPNTSFSGNPFELEVDGTFTHTATGTQITLPGYYDGNHIWNVAFMPTMVGAWTYMTHSSDAELNGQTGAVDVSASGHPGMLVADPSHPNKWKYTDGDFVVPIGVFASAMLDPSSQADDASNRIRGALIRCPKPDTYISSTQLSGASASSPMLMGQQVGIAHVFDPAVCHHL